MATSKKISNLSDHQFMNDLFPFYILMDTNLKVQNFGSSIQKMTQITKGDFFHENFLMNRPLNVLSFEDISKYRDSIFIFKSLKKSIEYRGQMYFDDEANLFCFIGSPLINSFDELKGHKVSLSDFALHDSVTQYLFTLQMHLSTIKDASNLAEELKITNVNLQRINESLDNLIYKLTHDLRAPAVNIQGMLNMLGSVLDVKNDEGRTALIYNNSMHSTKKLIQTIDDFLQLSRLERVKPRDPENCDLDNILAGIEEANQYEFKKRKVVLTKELGLCNEIYGIPEDVKSIFQNLIINSVKYCSKEKSPKITIKGHLEGKYKVLSITDNGIGIDLKNQKNKMFKMFSRLHFIPSIPGTGIGLYMVKKLITRNKGFVAVTSSVVDEGTTFTLHFLNN